MYARTRHNAGFWVADCLSARWGWRLEPFGDVCQLGSGAVGGHDVLLAKPDTFMNESGRALGRLVERFALVPGNVLVVCDCIDLPLGRIRLRPSGGDGGHRGLVSVAEALASEEYPRLRVGVGRPPEGVDAADFVLGRMSAEVEAVVARVVPRAADAVEAAICGSVEQAMAEFNGRVLDDENSAKTELGGC